MKKKTDNVEFAVFGEAVPAKETPQRRFLLTHMTAEQRVSFYLTVAGLLEGGLSVRDAGHLVVNEYNAASRRHEAAAASVFFDGLQSTEDMDWTKATATMGEVANKAFGPKFTGTEEMILLRSLPMAKSQGAVLRAAANIVSLRFGVTDERISAAAARG